MTVPPATIIAMRARCPVPPFAVRRTPGTLHHQRTPAKGLRVGSGARQLAPSPATWAKVAEAAARDPQAWWADEGANGTCATRRFRRDAPSGFGITRFWHADDLAKPWRGEFRAVLRLRARPVPLDRVGWVDFDANDSLLFSIGGRFYRCLAAALEKVTGTAALVVRARLLADFTDLRFRVLRAPYLSGHLGAPDAEAPTDAFAPRLDRVTKAERMQMHRERQILCRQAKDRTRW